MFTLPDFKKYIKIYICMEVIIYIWEGKVTIVTIKKNHWKSLYIGLYIIRQRKHNLSTENNICRQTYRPENTAVKLKNISHPNFSEMYQTLSIHLFGKELKKQKTMFKVLDIATAH